MNVLFLSELFYPHGGGAELATYLYAKLLGESEFNVVVVTNRFSGEPEFSRNEGFAVYRLPLFKRGKSVKYSVLLRVDVLFSSFLRKWVKWADVVYVPRYWFSAIPFAKSCGKPVITHLHDYVPICPLATFFNSKKGRVCENTLCSLNCIYWNEKKNFSLLKAAGSALLNFSIYRFLKRCIKSSDAVLCVSKAQRDILAMYAPRLASKLSVIYNPMPKLSPIAINGGDFGFFGGASYMKGFPILKKALEYGILRGLEPITVHGTKFKNLEKHFVDRLRALGFLVYGKLGNLDFEKIYGMTKAVIVPSVWHEPLPYVVAEALLRGRVVIASRVGGIPELLCGCEGAFMTDAGNYKHLAEIIDYVDNMNVESVVDLGLKNRHIFLNRFSTQDSFNAFSDVLRAVSRHF